jgi:hypothetical protein
MYMLFPVEDRCPFLRALGKTMCDYLLATAAFLILGDSGEGCDNET